ncbi:NAD(P)H-dependent oxidoreductase [Variovorax paradoxus]|uniref:FMN-dependent NADH-azoreductase n=1 Tax=Variovorax paradoxus TaxID=34073 RepID=UPI001ABD1DF2
MNILHLDCSPRGQDSESRRLSHRIVEHLRGQAPAALLVRRAIGDGGLAHIDANYALGQHSATAEVAPRGAVATSDALIEELEKADVVVIGTPMHNLSLPSVLKAWIDHVVRARRTFRMTPEGKVGMLRDRPVFIAIASGGRFSGERARQPDFLTPYLRAILGSIGLTELHFFSVQGTGLGEAAVAEARSAADLALAAHFAS